MARTVADFIVARLAEWGVRRAFGYPGDGINGVFGALDRADGLIELVQSRHEETAALMAAGHARLTGDVGVCIATSGPGAVHVLNGLYDAKLNRQPLVAIVGQQARASLGADYQQEIDLPALFKDVAGAYVQMVTVPEQARHVIDSALRIARAERTVTCVILPNDVQELDAVDGPPREHGSVFSGTDYTEPLVLPTASDLERAARVLNDGDRVAVLIGAGARTAAAEVTEVAEVLGAGVAKALLGKDVLDDRLPFVTGALGLLGTTASWNMMQECDTLLMVGTSFPYAEFLPQEGQARGVQIDIDGRRLGRRYPTEVNLVGDSRETLRALLPLLERKEDRRWSERVRDWNESWREVVAARSRDDANPINPQMVFSELSRRLPDRAVVAVDTGTSTSWYARNVDLREGMTGVVSGTLATMGVAVPYGIAAKFAYPTRPVFALVGDGAMQMSGLAELITVTRYWRQWHNPKFVVVVLNNRDLNMVSWEQRATMGDPKFPASQDLPDVRYAEWARSLGLGGIRVEEPTEVEAALDQALAADRPFVLEVLTDGDIPPLPPHVTFAEARSMMSALAKGDPDAVGIVKRSLTQKLHDITH